jgi:hypothetical protein
VKQMPVKRVNGTNQTDFLGPTQTAEWVAFSGEICGTDLVAAVVSSGLCLPVVMKASAAPRGPVTKGAARGPPHGNKISVQI